MRFLLDQDVYAATTRFLLDLNHDVVTAASIDLAEAPDSALLNIAKELTRILVTRDRDFGNLVFVGRVQVGVVYLRVLPTTLSSCHQELHRVLQSYSEDELNRAFVVVEPGRHRLRRFPA